MLTRLSPCTLPDYDALLQGMKEVPLFVAGQDSTEAWQTKKQLIGQFQ